jgi:hypothetical protein
MSYSDALYVMARDLSALMKISTTINAIRGLDELQKALIELLFEVVPARRGAILLTPAHNEPADEFESTFGIDRLTGTEEAIPVSQTIVHRVLRDGSALLIRESDSSESLKTDSLIAARSRSVILPATDHARADAPVSFISETDEPESLSAKPSATGHGHRRNFRSRDRNARHIESLQNENQRLIADANIELT